MIPLSPLHADVAAALHARCFTEAWDANSLCRLISMPSAFGFLAESSPHGPSGFVLCQGAADVCEVVTLCVLAEHRRRGTACRLIVEACAAGARAGAEALLLEVAADNLAAREFYAGMAFMPGGPGTPGVVSGAEPDGHE
ncbi:MAG: GNAT family N-acetyltransferase, partial [Alphaproteobacteria bacterium]